MIHIYGGKDSVMLVGVNDFGSGIPSPFLATAPRAPMEAYMRGMDAGLVAESAQRKLLLAAFENNGTVVMFENPDAAQRLTELLALAFDTAANGPWGDINDDERTLQ